MSDNLILLMSDKIVLLPLTNVRHIAQQVRLPGKTSLHATYYSEPRKMKNLDTILIGTVLLANKGLLLKCKTCNFSPLYTFLIVLLMSDNLVLLAWKNIIQTVT